eukprot:TRINITY_DN9236_c0_g1_i1.p1 TRINITY_DN9236_c0_g1~~TRINITY_DN9236_c0_g1_i1.p1  ORF type:complete len:436 (+),score=93.05 TRINITY_DN9236_c0_g1_i1:37-1308(+)
MSKWAYVKQFTKSIIITGMLVTGSINTLSKKWQNDTSSKGIHGIEQQFDQPWTQTLFMYSGEALCLIAYFFVLLNLRKNERKALEDDYEKFKDNQEVITSLPNSYQSTNKSKLNVNDDLHPDEIDLDIDKTPKNYFWNKYPHLKPFLFLMTGFMDLFGTSLSAIGLVYTPASIYQMLRGSIIVFSGILSIIFLKRKLFAFNWLGMAVTIFGLVLVGLSSFFDPNQSGTGATSTQVLVGNILVIVAQLFSACQFIIEEVFIKKHKFHSLQVVGSEGSWGVIMMIFFVLPICYFIPGNQYGHYEFSINGFVMIFNSWLLIILIVVYIVSIAFYNFFGLLVAKELTTVHRTFIDTCRTVVVWGVQVFVYYVISESYGQRWDVWSWLQLAGFFFLVLGTFIYNGILKIPKLFYPTKEDQEKENQKVG